MGGFQDRICTTPQDIYKTQIYFDVEFIYHVDLLVFMYVS